MREADSRQRARVPGRPPSRGPGSSSGTPVRAGATAVLLLLLACGSSVSEPVSERHPLRVFAAASLADVLEELATDRGELPPFEVHLAGSEVLLRQVAAGAPADVLLLARPLVAAELPEGAEVRVLAGTALVVAGPALPAAGAARPAPRTPAELRGCRLAVADPDLAPAGAYAEAALAAAGLLDAVADTRVVAAHVRDACRWVALGEADAVICYRVDVRALDALVELFAFPDVEVRYGAALTASPPRRESARRWLEGLAARPELLEAHGLIVVAP